MDNTPVKIEDKIYLIEQASKFNIKDIITEEDFDSALDRLGATLLFGTKWEDRIINNPKLRRNLPILNDIPLYCKGPACEYAQICPIMLALRETDKPKLVGTRCRVEKDFALRKFTELVTELDITPDATTDILNVTSLVRLLILQNRIDWRMAIHGQMDKKVGASDKQGRVTAWNEEPTQFIKLGADINKQIGAIQSQLMASRKDRAQYNNVNKTAELLKSLLVKRQEKKEEDIIDASYIEGDD